MLLSLVASKDETLNRTVVIRNLKSEITHLWGLAIVPCLQPFVRSKSRITANRPDGIELDETHAGNAIRRAGITIGEHPVGAA